MVDVIHAPVLREEVFSLLEPQRQHALVIDSTLGEGGHAELFLARRPDLSVIGIDADPGIMAVARERLSNFGDRIAYHNTWFNRFFGDYPRDLDPPDTVLFDLGISSFHYERGMRGFSFKRDEALDMRLEGSLELSAEDIVNEYPERELADLIFEYGEERYSRRIARYIVEARESERILASGQLADIVKRATPQSYRYGRIHPATRTFQALRIAVNGELVRLTQALQGALRILRVGGRVGVISFHSLEDRIVKQFFREKSKSCTCPPEWPICKCGGKQIVELISKKPIRPTEGEVETNPASRSARFRVAEKLNEEEV